MSRTFLPTSCKFFLGLLASAIAIAGSLNAQEAHPQALASASATSVGVFSSGQPFLSLLDDVTIKNQPNSDDYYSQVAQCKLNAPVDLDSDVVDEAPPKSEDNWATLLTYACNDKTCNNCPSFTFTNSSQSRSIKSCNRDDGPSSDCPESCFGCVAQTPNRKSEAYCDQMAQLLATTLYSSQASFEAKSSAIESAMSMVAEKSLADAELQIAELKAAHQKEINQLQGKLLSAQDQTESLAQIMSWLRPIYTNQNRNYRQLQRLSADQDGQPKNDLSKLETSNPITNRLSLPSSAQMANKLLADHREMEIARLKKELEIIDARLSRLVVKPFKRASHLEPVYVPKQQLVPIHDLPQRHTLLEKLEPARRIR